MSPLKTVSTPILPPAALLLLLRTWWRVLLLLVILAVNLAAEYKYGSRYPFWILTFISFTTLVALVPDQTVRQALSIGMGGAFCLIPLLHLAVYNPVGDRLIGEGWSHLGGNFGWWTSTLSLFGLAVFLVWARWRVRRVDVSLTMAIASGIILLLAVAPFFSEVVASLSLRELYHLPTVYDIPSAGAARTQYIKWKMLDVQIDSFGFVFTWVSFALALIICAGVLALRVVARCWPNGGAVANRVFPARPDLPWVNGLIGSGIAWAHAAILWANLDRNFRDVGVTGHHASSYHTGIMFIVLAPAFCFMLCAFELMRRLSQAELVHLFYASMIVLFEVAVLVLNYFIGFGDAKPAWLLQLVWCCFYYTNCCSLGESFAMATSSLVVGDLTAEILFGSALHLA